ncbi:MAG TPA: hypothetical protein VLC93_08895 [Myxococcota bacterium]|nr:hypothetical protein [Myxococcota bacterium]
MLVPCLQCKSPVFVSGSAVAAGDVRSTCGNCGTALVVERGGVVRLAEPPPGPAAAPQLIVPPTFEPPSHATTMREFAIADESPATNDGPDADAFYVARQPPVDARNFDALLGADVRAYVDDPREAPREEAPQAAFSGPASFGADEQLAPALPPPLPPPRVLPDFAPAEPLQQASGPELTPPEQTFVPADASHTPINMPFDAPAVENVDEPPPAEPPPPLMPGPPKHFAGESRYEPLARERPPALMFPSANVGGMSGPAREAEQTRPSQVMRAESAPPTPLAEPVLLTDPTPAPEVLDLAQDMPEWSGESFDEAAAYVPPFASQLADDDNAGAERQRRGTYPTPDSYFDASDPLAAAEADIYAGHQVVSPTDLVGDAFTAMVPPVGIEVPRDASSVEQPMQPPVVNDDAALDAEELAALRGNKKRGLWAAAACLVFAVGGASYAASRGYLDPLIAKVGEMMARSAAPEEVGVPSPAPDAPKPDAPIAEGANADQPNPDAAKADTAVAGAPTADTPKPDAPTVESPKAAQPPADGKPADPLPLDTQAKAGLASPSAMTDNTTAGEAKPAGAPSKALQACYSKGNRYLNAKKISLAIRELNKCLDIDPTYGRTYRSLGVAYMQLGRERSAILAYEKFVDYEPQHKDVAKVREIIADYYRRRKN